MSWLSQLSPNVVVIALSAAVALVLLFRFLTPAQKQEVATDALAIAEAVTKRLLGAFVTLPSASGAGAPAAAAVRSRLRPYVKRPRTRTAGRPWKIADLCKAYQWPSSAPGIGQIGIVELGGGWTREDLAAFFGGAKLPEPTVADVVVDGPGNQPGVDPDADGEVALDIQIAAASYALATGKAARVRVYWSASSIGAALAQAVADGCSVVSISWGADEAAWSAADRADLERAMMAAAARGVIVCAAAGDNDSSDGGPGRANVDLPASHPLIIGCGGTSKTDTAEVVWNNNPGQSNGSGTGGGFSTLYAVPPWQVRDGATGKQATHRMVPDVAAVADPDTGYLVIIDGQEEIIGGTSAVAPLYAGLLAACAINGGYLEIGAALWGSSGCFTDITSGNNGAYKAATGPDPCTGLGAPMGAQIASALASRASARK